MIAICRCEVCDSWVIGEKYGDGICESCGQEYEYNESHRIVLNAKQLEMLKSLTENNCPGTQIRQSE